MGRTRKCEEAAGKNPAVPKNEEIYVDLMDYMDDDYPFQIFVGCRGMGKTYSGLKGGPESQDSSESSSIPGGRKTSWTPSRTA